MKKLGIFVYGAVSYGIAFATLLQVIGFIGNLWAPEGVNL